MNKILYVGYLEFPYGMAQVQRQIAMSKMLINAGYDVTVLCRNGIYSKEQIPDMKAEGVFEGINYKYCSGTPYRPASFFERNLLKIKGTIKEFNYIVKLGSKKELKAVFISTNFFYNVLIYGLACKLGRVQAILDNVEYFSYSKETRSKFEKKDAYLYDKYLFNFVDKVICISEFLVKKAAVKMPIKNILKIPVITQFDKFNIKPKNINNESYILYCGAISYYEVIEFTISSFEKSINSHYLYLITKKNDELENRINKSPKKDKIRVFSDISFEKLTELYNQCEGFIIPLRPKIKDEARFPHKISEFCATSKPFISNKFGEVAVYFKDTENAYLCENYESSEFAMKIDELYADLEKAKLIGKNAHIVGQQFFSHLSYSEKIKAFLNS